MNLYKKQHPHPEGICPPFYSKLFTVRWCEVDFNGHMSNASYLNLATDVRMMFFKEHGFTVNDFKQLRIGPVAVQDEISYYKELRLMDEIEVHLELVGLSRNDVKMQIRNIFYRKDKQKAASILTTGVWFHLDERKAIPAPPKLLTALNQVPRSADFRII